MIPQRNISLISNNLLKQDHEDGHASARRVPERTIELDYCLAWFLSCLPESTLGSDLAFKGGTALRRCHIGEYRFSEDLDFTALREGITMDDLRRGIDQIGLALKRQAGIEMAFDRPDSTTHQNSHTFYVAYTGPVGRRDSFKVDVTLKEMLVGSLERKPIIKTYKEFSDLPAGPEVLCYPLTEIVAEKVVALSDKARTQPRDLYDLWYLTEFEKVNLDTVQEAVAAKLNFRGRENDDIGALIARKEATLKKLWAARLSVQMSALPEFDDVFRTVSRNIRQAGFAVPELGTSGLSGRKKL